MIVRRHVCWKLTSLPRETEGSLPVLGEVGGLHLAKHDSGVAIKEGNAGETLAVGEGVHNHGLLGHEDGLGLVVGLELHGTLGLLATGLLAETPVDLDETAGGTPTADV